MSGEEGTADDLAKVESEMTDAISGRLRITGRGLLNRALGAGTRLARNLAIYLFAITGTVAALVFLWTKVPYLHSFGVWGFAAVGALLVGVLVLGVLSELVPVWLASRRKKILEGEYVSGKAVPPNTFRLAPYEGSDHDVFVRYDGVHESVRQWIGLAKCPILYLTGRSGVGKSSIVQAWVIEELERNSPRGVGLVVRSFADPLGALINQLREPGRVWKKPPESDAVYSLLEKATRSLAPGRLLVFLDQFEEILILQDSAGREPLRALLRELAEHRIEGLIVLIGVRSDYQGQLLEMIASDNLPEMRAGGSVADQTWFEVPLFTEAHASEFLDESGLKLGSKLRDGVIRELSALEDTPGVVRPITLNMAGRVLQPYEGRLPSDLRIGELMRSYLRTAVTEASSQDVAPILQKLRVAESGTKRPRSIEELAEMTNKTKGTVGGCLVRLEARGLVRRLHGAQEVWEIAHDFIANLLGEILAGLRPRFFERIRSIALTASILAWIGIAAGAFFVLPKWMANEARRSLSNAGAEVIETDLGNRIVFSDVTVNGGVPFEKYLRWLQPIFSVTFSGTNDMTGLSFLSAFDEIAEVECRDDDNMPTVRGIPDLANLQMITVDDCDGVVSLETHYRRVRSLYVNSSYGIKALPEISSLVALRDLVIAGNIRLEKITDIRNMNSLVNVIVTDNSVVPLMSGINRLNYPQELVVEIEQNSLPSLEVLVVTNRMRLVSSGLTFYGGFNSASVVVVSEKLAISLEVPNIRGQVLELDPTVVFDRMPFTDRSAPFGYKCSKQSACLALDETRWRSNFMALVSSERFSTIAFPSTPGGIALAEEYKAERQKASLGVPEILFFELIEELPAPSQ